MGPRHEGWDQWDVEKDRGSSLSVGRLRAPVFLNRNTGFFLVAGVPLGPTVESESGAEGSATVRCPRSDPVTVGLRNEQLSIFETLNTEVSFRSRNKTKQNLIDVSPNHTPVPSPSSRFRTSPTEPRRRGRVVWGPVGNYFGGLATLGTSQTAREVDVNRPTPSLREGWTSRTVTRVVGNKGLTQG